MRFWSRIVLAAAMCALAVSPVAAQEITATLTGTVTDETDAVLPGVTVTVRNTGTGLSKDVVTTSEGVYTAPLLPTGRYEVTFTLGGFQPATATNLQLHVNDRVRLDMKLKTGGVTETVEVSAAAQMIQPMAAVQSLMGATQVQELPLNNRNFIQLATLVPGVSSSLADEVGIGLTNLTSLSINGAGATGSTGWSTGPPTWTWARTSRCSTPRRWSRSRSSRSSPRATRRSGRAAGAASSTW